MSTESSTTTTKEAMPEQPTIKLFVSCHRDHVYLPKSDLVVPVQVNCANTDMRIDGIAHDDEGENISELNPRYCELTAQYWAWKNADADYYGFMHYRRYFSFASEHFPTNYFGDVEMQINDDATFERINFDEASIRSAIEGYDFVVPEPGAFVDGATMGRQYGIAEEQRAEDLRSVVEIIDERHPDFSAVTRRYLESTQGYFCNMFVMRRELFEGYCEWLFDILAEFDRRRDFSSYGSKSLRVDGYLAERLCGIYLMWLSEQGYRSNELQRVLFDYVDEPVALEPAFGDNQVSVVLSADGAYVPYLSALLQSIHDTRSASRTYDIVVLTTSIEPRDQAILKEQVGEDNFSLRFLDVTRMMHNYTNRLFLRGHFSVETYFRLLLGDLLPAYDKMLYLDCDMIVRHDIAELFDTDVEGFLVAACRDADSAGLYNGMVPSKKAYVDEVLGLADPYGYFQAGMVLFNLAEWRDAYSVEDVFACASERDWELLDQDVLNVLCQGRVTYVDMKWNSMVDWLYERIPMVISIAPAELEREYLAAHNDPYIVHFAGPDKPWSDPESDQAHYFWEVCRRTPYYEVTLARMVGGIARPGLRRRTKEVAHQVADGIKEPLKKATESNPKAYEKMQRLYRKVIPEKPRFM